MGDVTPPAPAGNNPNPPAPGADPKPPVTPEPGTAFDPSKLSDDDLAKLYDDPRLYKHERFKQLSERAKKAKEYEENQAKMEEEQLKKKGEFEQLANKHKEEANTWKSKFTTSLTDNAIISAASKSGIKDVDAALKLVDRSAITVNDDGKVEGIEAAIEALVKDKPYLLTVNRSTVGSPTNPSNSSNAPAKFKMSQLSDVKFYQENAEAIKKAMLAGEIEEDRW